MTASTRSSIRPARQLWPLVILTLGACARMAPPVAFPDSSAFRAIDSTVYGILEMDLHADGMPDAVVVQQVGLGFVPAVYEQAEGDERSTAWSRVCTGDAVVGEELDTVQWVTLGGRQLVLLTASERNPDEVMIHGALVDPRDDCATRLSERVVLRSADGAVVAPGPVPGGFSVAEDGTVRIVDGAEYLDLDGPNGEVSILTGVRVRTLRGGEQAVAMESSRVSFLTALAAAARWERADAAPLELAELVDGGQDAAFVARPGEQGTLALKADGPILLLELRHGCLGDESRPLVLTLGEDVYTTGTPPPASSFVRAAGRGHATTGGVRLDLVALTEPAAEIRVSLGPVDAERCVRETKAYGFVR